MKRLTQSPTDPDFVQNPYPFYDSARAGGDLFHWTDYDMVCAVSHRAVSAALRDRRMGREVPAERQTPIPPHQQPFYDIEAHSMLELEPPRHTRLRGLVLRAFTSRRIGALAPEIETLCDRLIADFPSEPFDLLDAFARPLPVVIIARLLGVPDSAAPDLLRWSNAMVAMYQASRTRQVEDDASTAARDFTAFLNDFIRDKRHRPEDDLISQLIAAEDAGEKLSHAELITTCILLLNAGHEATVHTLGNGVKTLLEHDHRRIDAPTVEEVLRYDPPLHLFTRWVYEEMELCGVTLKRGDQIGCLLGAANRDPQVYDAPHEFRPGRTGPAHTAFGGGIHFCVGAPLARLELEIGFRTLMQRCPDLRLDGDPRYGNVYHFHGLDALMVRT